MSDNTSIEWTDTTWNPVTGCSKVSPGCAHCYAEALTKRFQSGEGQWKFKPWTPENAGENVVLHPDRLDAPLRWKKPRRVFVNSMSDLFHELVPDEFIDRVFAVMALTPWHTYQVLTKRPERMRAYMTNTDIGNWTGRATYEGQPWPAALWRVEAVHFENLKAGLYPPDVLNRASEIAEREDRDGFVPAWPLPNVWLGVSVENQHFADERIPLLLQTPAAVRFLSCEPLLGPVDLNHLSLPGSGDPWLDCLRGEHVTYGFGRDLAAKHKLHWVIVGGESGPRARAMDLAWARSLVEQCKAAGVAVFVKQLGGLRPGSALEALPEDLRIREFPEVK